MEKQCKKCIHVKINNGDKPTYYCTKYNMDVNGLDGKDCDTYKSAVSSFLNGEVSVNSDTTINNIFNE